jgi:hypothetical protein
MPVDIALHPIGTPVNGNHPTGFVIPRLAGQAALAAATNSNAIVVPSPGGKLHLVSTVKARVDIRLTADAASLNAGTSGMILGANERCIFSLPPGSYTLVTADFV